MRPHTLLTRVVWRRESEKPKERNLTRKVDMPALIAYLNRKLYLSAMRLDVAPRPYTKRHVFIGHWTMFSKYANRYRFNSQHKWKDLYDHLTSTRIFSMMTHMTHIRNNDARGNEKPRRKPSS